MICIVKENIEMPFYKKNQKQVFTQNYTTNHELQSSWKLKIT